MMREINKGQHKEVGGGAAHVREVRALAAHLSAWRMAEAERLGLPLYRVLATDTIREIAARMPKTKAELLSVKGIKERKFFQYGAEILGMVADIRKDFDTNESEAGSLAEIAGENASAEMGENAACSVSVYLSLVNKELARLPAQIVGEVGSVDMRDTYLFFTLKDTGDGSALSCFMWMSDYTMAGYEIGAGDEVAVAGTPELYKPTGRFSFRVTGISPVGEGSLKKAYDILYKKLGAEGLFRVDRKRPLPAFPVRIGLITSRAGAVIGDFLNNLERWGFSVRFVHSRVEGAHAVRDILSAIGTLEKEQVDALVLIRGGGSMESLQAFNNELVVRAIASFPAPVVCGIGHDKDVPLAALAADHMASTPTATAVLISSRFREEWRTHEIIIRKMINAYAQALSAKKYILDAYGEFLKSRVEGVASLVRGVHHGMAQSVLRITEQLSLVHHRIAMEGLRLSNLFTRGVDECRAHISETETALAAWDPQKALSRGYAIVRGRGGGMARAHAARVGDNVDITLADGTIKATVTSISTR